jgi:hypothetical protein
LVATQPVANPSSETLNAFNPSDADPAALAILYFFMPETRNTRLTPE